MSTADKISIHALLAESDGGSGVGSWPRVIFLSTLSLRRATRRFIGASYGRTISIYALLAESDRERRRCCRLGLISIHALLAESDYDTYAKVLRVNISIHALLAESDDLTSKRLPSSSDFYPRSPCGERQSNSKSSVIRDSISIHALLAESDHSLSSSGWAFMFISIHALLAESDDLLRTHIFPFVNFYPRSPCGERPSTPAVRSQFIHFYPRSPCGERQLRQTKT